MPTVSRQPTDSLASRVAAVFLRTWQGRPSYVCVLWPHQEATSITWLGLTSERHATGSDHIPEEEMTITGARNGQVASQHLAFPSTYPRSPHKHIHFAQILFFSSLTGALDFFKHNFLPETSKESNVYFSSSFLISVTSTPAP